MNFMKPDIRNAKTPQILGPNNDDNKISKAEIGGRLFEMYILDPKLSLFQATN